MSRGFVREGDQEEMPVVPPRASLPPGVPNFVTPAGYQALLSEKEHLENEKQHLSLENEAERRRDANFIDAKIKLLQARINSARVIDLKAQPQNEVRFGAVVSFLNGAKRQEFQLVGVDEANIKLKKIPFTAPIARALTGKKIDETVNFKLGNKTQILKILAILYPI